MTDDEKFMKEALKQAKKAYAIDIIKFLFLVFLASHISNTPI